MTARTFTGAGGRELANLQFEINRLAGWGVWAGGIEDRFRLGWLRRDLRLRFDALEHSTRILTVGYGRGAHE